MFKKNRTEDIRTKAFFAGTQGIDPSDTLKEIEANFEQKREDLVIQSIDEIKELEAKTEIVNQRKTEAEKRWTVINTLTADRATEFWKPTLAIVIALVMVLGEGRLLAPVTDGLNVTDPQAQWVVASVIILAFSLFMKWAVHSFKKTPQNLIWTIVPSSFGLIAMAMLGWWRGEEVIFASQHLANGNTFASETALLTKVLMMMITVALPTIAAVAFEFGLERGRLWLEWHRARRDVFNFSRELEEKRKRLEARKEKRDRELEKITQEREAWLAAARDAHIHGLKVGAHKRPLWELLIFIISIGILIFAVVMVFSFIFVNQFLAEFIKSSEFRFLLFLSASLGITGLFAMRALRRWNRPTEEELFNDRVTHWSNADHPDSLIVNHNSHGQFPTSITEDEMWEEKTILTTR
jgi:hypothetical protein